ncbi:acylneuraminate cytidylyltransferase family protein [Gammaproteobacteria bacterium]|jgi:N-acylneuraminate cytidylyltransferase|nr:acylneuraminate cytidylyltransferase family protein [Gammaproteobacteria bacterium]MDC1021660.1 acylneuraminate cytidylyltransferase family protein [Gammaproteobacteria bacterium]
MVNCFIFARGGSKGLPKKNIKMFHGLPLISYSISLAKNASFIDRVFVSTDCKEIANVASKFSADVIKRPKSLATDTSSELLSWKHAIEYVVNNYGTFDYFISLPATSPLRAESDVEACLNKLRDDKSDICLTVTESSHNPRFNMVYMRDDSKVQLIDDNHLITRRQDAQKAFNITTVAYAALPEYVLNTSNLMNGDVSAVTVPKNRAVDIDDINDFNFAEFLFQNTRSA